MSGTDAASPGPSAPAPEAAFLPGAGSEEHPEPAAEMRNRPRIAGTGRFPTAVLLTCAALGVAGAILLGPANWLSTLLAGVPFLSMGFAGLWLLPSVIALRLLRRPLVGLLAGLLAGLVLVPFSGYGFASVLTNLWWAAFTELPFLFVLWRYWGAWMHYAGAVIVGVVYPVSAWAWFDLGAFGLWYQVAFFAVTIASCVVATALGILIADRLRRAGVGGRAPRG
ncbi:hypothetical protein MHM582_2869 [Microbacterium sp. HM58-2]|nr:hypothetical protein MHM582_2869 [Microbacterium sp. HM58-2]